MTDHVLQGVEECVVYTDNVLSNAWEEHFSGLHNCLEKSSNANLVVNLKSANL